MRIDIACGGTGGHTFPGVATAFELRRRGHDITLWLAGKGVEHQTAQGWDGPVQAVNVHASGGSLGGNLGSVMRLALAVVPAWRKLRRNRPDVMLAMGSYACVAPALAARLSCIPLILHEANVVPGAAVKLLSRFARETATHFEETARYLPGCRCAHTGFPVRPEFLSVQRQSHEGFTLLVAGGSQGAHALNECVPEALEHLKSRGLSCRVIHLAGTRDCDTVASRYDAAGISHDTRAFMPDIWNAYASADLAVMRAGAATCAELAICGLPALLVPYPYAARDHQRANAQVLASADSVDVIDQNALSSRWLADYLEKYIREPHRLVARREALARLAVPDAASRLAERIEALGGI